MASTFAVTRNHLIFGLCLPLAVLMGYVLAEPLESTSLTVLLMIIAGLIVPVLLRWYHPLLIFSWNLYVYPAFLPGSPQLWALMSMLGLGFAVLNRSVNPEFRFAQVPAITLPLLAMVLVVGATAMATGGIGLRVLGSQSMGGKGYFYLAAAVAGYFALSSQAIPRHRVKLAVALFFLPGVTAIIGRLAQAAGPGASFLFLLFPPESDLSLLEADTSFDLGMTRASGIMAMAMAIFSWLLARHGVAGVFDFSRPWRMAILIGAVVLGTLGGFRSAVLLMVMTFLILFWLEKLWGTRIFLIMVIGLTLGGALLVGFADKLPLTIQRSLSFLPLEIDPLTRISAQDSTEWRLEIWKATLPQVPQYFFKGKGYNLSGDELYMSRQSSFRGLAAQWEGAALAGDYHNGPLSVLIPFGIWGLAAFAWLLVTGVRFLYTNFRESAPELRQINAFLLALFLARILFFVFIFGTLDGDLFHFAGILGFSVALNISGQKSNQAGRLNDGA
jgi:hypothetical protein